MLELSKGKSIMTKEAFTKSILAQIGGDRKHGWGTKDSANVIRAILEDEIGEKPDEDTVMKWIIMVINPSAFRQVLEKENQLDKSENTREKHEKLFASVG